MAALKILYVNEPCGLDLLFHRVSFDMYYDLMIKLLNHNINFFEDISEMFPEENSFRLSCQKSQYGNFVADNKFYSFSMDNEARILLRTDDCFHQCIELCNASLNRPLPLSYKEIKKKDIHKVYLSIWDCGSESITLTL